MYLFARSTALLGDLKRDQGVVLGPLCAQLDLSPAVVTEMSGTLEVAARNYENPRRRRPALPP